MNLVAAYAHHHGTHSCEAFATLAHEAAAGNPSAARALGLDVAPLHETSRAPIADVSVSTAICARMACDMAPDLGLVGPDRLLGDRALTAPPSLQLLALGASCFHAIEEDWHHRSPFRMWCRRKPLAPAHVRQRMRAVDRQPHRVVRSTPTETLDLIDGTAWAGRDGLAPGLHLTRMVHTQAGDMPHLVFPLDNVDIAALRRWRERRLWRLRLATPHATLEDVMRGPAWLRAVLRHGCRG